MVGDLQIPPLVILGSTCFVVPRRNSLARRIRRMQPVPPSLNTVAGRKRRSVVQNLHPRLQIYQCPRRGGFLRLRGNYFWRKSVSAEELL
jgi:hypothetical protein